MIGIRLNPYSVPYWDRKEEVRQMCRGWELDIYLGKLHLLFLWGFPSPLKFHMEFTGFCRANPWRIQLKQLGIRIYWDRDCPYMGI